MRSGVKVLNIIAVVLFILAAVMIYKGVDKMTNYDYSEYSTSHNHNAYVGGDAYNYIINGNYTTGFFTLGVGFLISGLVCIGTGMIVTAIDKKNL